jgi:quercetin dioxygenase-like cupin family protein
VTCWRRRPAGAGDLLTGALAELTLPGVGSTGARLTVLAATGLSGTGSGLVASLAEVPPGARHVGSVSSGGELWFVIEGSGRLTLDGAPGPALVPDRGLLMPAGSAYQAECAGGGDLRLDIAALPAASSEAGRLPAIDGDRQPLCRDLRDCPAETTGDRIFRVLFGPGRDCAVATQFVGEIPPGRAPEHRHPYDEVVLVLQGTGVAHVDGTERALSPGTCLHLPPGRGHCLENSGPEALRVLGVFHPADSPAAKLAASLTSR